MFTPGRYLIDPDLILDKAHIRQGFCVGDLGCGRTGHLTFPLARKVGENGRVYALDILKDVLHNIEERKKSNDIKHLHTVWGDLEKIGTISIPERSLDAAFLINVLHQSKKQLDILEETVRLLKNKARLILVDWLPQGEKFGIKPEMLVNFDKFIAEAFKKNFVIQEKFIAGPHHYGIVFFKHD